MLSLDLSWLNNNYQRMLARYARRCSADRLRDLQAERRYGVLVCFLWQIYRDTIDYLVDMHDNRQIKQVTDWQLSEEAQRQALAQLVNAISRLDVTQAWGVGRASSSDGQRFRFRRQVLQRTYSHRLNDYALEFYSFVADNYAPFFSDIMECTDRDAPHVLDGLLYNESDLPLEEHYTDTHGYTEINFAAFAMLGKRFAPRIRGLHK
jgi:TnpA family transposase